MKLSEWMELPLEQRDAHIDLSTPCILKLGRSGKPWRWPRSLLLDHLGLEDDIGNWTEGRLTRRHLCSHGQCHGNCSNPAHVSIGTVSENQRDDDVGKIRLKKVRKPWQNKKGREPSKKAGAKVKHMRAISMIDGFMHRPPLVSSRNSRKGWKNLWWRVPDHDIAVFEALSPLQRLMALEMVT